MTSMHRGLSTSTGRQQEVSRRRDESGRDIRYLAGMQSMGRGSRITATCGPAALVSLCAKRA